MLFVLICGWLVIVVTGSFIAYFLWALFVEPFLFCLFCWFFRFPGLKDGLRWRDINFGFHKQFLRDLWLDYIDAFSGHRMSWREALRQKK